MSRKPDLVLGVDASTTAVKVIVWDLQGNAVSEGRCPVSLSRPQPSWHEQPAEEWWHAFSQSAKAALVGIQAQRLAAVCIAHQRETFVVVDEDGRPLRPAIVWMDERARSVLPTVKARLGEDRFHDLAGKPLSGNLLPGKLAWLAENEPGVFNRIYKILDVHAYLVYRLTRFYRTSTGSADPLGLYDMRQDRWLEDALRSVGLSATHMPQAFRPGEVIGEVQPDAAEKCGLSPGLPVVAGIGDGQAGGLGANITSTGESYLNLGTAVVSGTLSSTYLTGRAFRTHYAGLPGAYTLETVILGGTYTNRWFVEQFADWFTSPGQWTEAKLDQAAGEVPPGALGLMLVPYWNTVLNPYWDVSASGMVVGWRGDHQPAHLYRAILEGIAFEQRLGIEGVEAAVPDPVQRFIAFGGGTRSRLWCQIIADVTGKPVHLAHAPEATALGAGILGAFGVGLYPDISQAAQAMTRRLPEPIHPDAKRMAFYDRLYSQIYRDLFPALQPILARLTRLTELGETMDST